MNLLCACGRTFVANVFKNEIQLLCDECIVFHREGRRIVAPSWRTDPKSSADNGSAGIASGVVGGEVGGVTPVPFLGPLAAGNRRG